MAKAEIGNNRGVEKKILFYGFLIIYFVGLILLGKQLNVTIDEVFTLNTSSRPVSGVISQSYNSEGQPPVYFVLLSFWRYINSSITFARIFSVLCIALAAFSFDKLVRLISKAGNSSWLVVVFLLNPFVVWAGAEIRLYAFLLFLTILSLFYFFRYFMESKNKDLFCFVLLGLVGLFTQYLFVFVFIALGFVLLLFRGWKSALKFTLYSLPVAALFLLGLLFSKNPMSLAQVDSLSTSLQERLNSVFHAPQDLMLAMNQVTFARMLRWLVMVLMLILLGNGYWQWYKKGRLTNKMNFQALNAILLSGFVLLVLFSVFFSVTGIDYHDRYLTISFPAFFLILLVLTIYPATTKRIIFAGISVLYISALFSIYKYPVKEYDDKSLATYVSSIENKNEPILFYQKVLSLPFQLYYTGSNALVPLPDSVAFDDSYFSKIKDTLQLQKAIGQVKTNPRSYLLITDRTAAGFNNDSDIQMLNEYVNTHYKITLDTLYFGNNKSYPLRIRRLEDKTK